MSLRIVALIVACSSSAALAQVVYEPLTVRYGGQNPYYYAGSDPSIHEAAKFPHVDGVGWGRTAGYAFVSPTRAVVERRTRVFTDAFGTVNARPYGLTPDDIVNQANAQLPRYFRKTDLLAAGTFSGPVRTVPATASGPTLPGGFPVAMPRGSILIRPMTPGLHGRPPVIVFPRGMLQLKIGDVVNGAQRRA